MPVCDYNDELKYRCGWGGGFLRSKKFQRSDFSRDAGAKTRLISREQRVEIKARKIAQPQFWCRPLFSILLSFPKIPPLYGFLLIFQITPIEPNSAPMKALSTLFVPFRDATHSWAHYSLQPLHSESSSSLWPESHSPTSSSSTRDAVC